MYLATLWIFALGGCLINIRKGYYGSGILAMHTESLRSPSTSILEEKRRSELNTKCLGAYDNDQLWISACKMGPRTVQLLMVRLFSKSDSATPCLSGSRHESPSKTSFSFSFLSSPSPFKLRRRQLILFYHDVLLIITCTNTLIGFKVDLVDYF